MYLIVLFEEENSVAGVPRAWVNTKKGCTYCYWPRKNEKVSTYIKRNEVPGEDWIKIACVIKSEAATYEQMRLKVKEAENTTTELDSDSDQDIASGHAEKNFSSSSSEEGICSKPPSPPRKKAKHTGMFLIDPQRIICVFKIHQIFFYLIYLNHIWCMVPCLYFM